MPPREVVYRLAGPGVAMARKVAPPIFPMFNVGPNAQFVDEGAQGRWHKAKLHYTLRYGGYGGVARIRIFATPANGYTLALVFMGGPEDEVQSIVDSVRAAR